MKNSIEVVKESVYSTIKKSRNGRITAKQLEEEICDKNKVRYALKYLQREHKVKKIRGLGTDRIDYFCQIINRTSDRNRL